MTIRAIGFDYGGVIEGEPAWGFNKKAADFLGIDVSTLQKSYFKFNALANTGKIDWDACWTMVLNDLGKSDRLPAFLEAHKTWNSRVVNTKMVGLIDKLRAAGYKVGILSNNTTERAKEMRATGIGDHVDVLIVSAETGLSKPDPAVFQLFFEKLGVDPKESLYIDDSESAIARAPEVGFTPILFTSYDELIVKLKSLGIAVQV